jgi:hypothetical protein
LVVVALLAMLTGLGTAQALSAHRIINLPWALAVLLGLPILSVLFWVLVQWPFALHQKNTPAFHGFFAHIAMALLQRLAPLLARSRQALPEKAGSFGDALTALRAVFEQSRSGFQMISALIHGLWALTLLAALAGLLVFFLVQEHRFVWETTLLSPQVLHHLQTALFWPFAETVFPSEVQMGVTPSDIPSDVWARRLLWVLFLYGVLPRFLLAMVCGLWAWHRLSASGLPWGEPVLAQWWGDADHHALGVLDPAPPKEHSSPVFTHKSPAHGLPVCVALLEPDPRWWPTPSPPHLPEHGRLWVLDRLETLQAVLDALEKEPCPVLLLINPELTPDRGHIHSMTALAKRASALMVAPAFLWLHPHLPPPPAPRLLLWEKSLQNAGCLALWRTTASDVDAFLNRLC